MKALLVAIALAVGASGTVAGYEPQSAERVSSGAETTPAYARLVLRKATVESELVELSALTNEHPSLEAKRLELRVIDREISMMRAFETSRVSKLCSAVGDLILSKVALQVELNGLRARLAWQHPEVAKKSIELAAVEREIESILP